MINLSRSYEKLMYHCLCILAYTSIGVVGPGRSYTAFLSIGSLHDCFATISSFQSTKLNVHFLGHPQLPKVFAVA